MENETKLVICRVCLNEIEETEKCFSVFKKYEDILLPGKEQDNVLIADKIVAIAQVDIKEGDGLPVTVCSNCLLELEDAYNFKRKCEKADDILRIANDYKYKTTTNNQFTNAVKEEVEQIEESSDEETKDNAFQYNDSEEKTVDGEEIEGNFTDEDMYLSEFKQRDSNKVTLDINPTDEDKSDSKVGKIKPNDLLKFKCELCKISLRSECKLRVHLQVEHGIFRCRNCKKVFKTNGALQRHRSYENCKLVVQTLSENILQAEKASQKSKSKVTPKSKTRVKLNITSDNPILTPHQTVTNATFKTDLLKVDKELEPISIKNCKAVDLKLECHDCGGIFKSKCKLRVHWKKEHSLILTCPSCRRTFKTYQAYKNHQAVKTVLCSNASNIRLVDEGGTLVYYCKQCTYKTTRKGSIKQHFVVHSNDKPQFKCDICLVSFVRKQTLLLHKESAHNVFHNVQKSCNICRKVFLRYNELMYHKRKHKEKKVFECDLCKQTFCQKYHLKNHIYKHMGVKKYPCNVCNAKFYTKNLASNHEKRSHSKRKYNCTVCGYTVKNKYVLNNHEVRHNSSNVCCHLCGKFLENDNQMRLHMQRHTNKTFCCKYCPMKYFDKKGLGKHIANVHINKCKDKIKRKK